MAVTVGYQAWDSANYAWDTAAAGKPVAELCSAINTWITTINGNASQSGKQLALIRDQNSSTTANYRGWVVEAPILNSVSRKMYWQYVTVNTTTAYARAFDDLLWVDSTVNGGYGGPGVGTGTSYILSDARSHKHTVTSFGDWTIAYETANGQEFFVAANYLDSNTGTYNDSFMLGKDNFGNWAVAAQDSSAVVGAYYDPYIDRVVYASNTRFMTTGSSATLAVQGKFTLDTPDPAISSGQTRRLAVSFANPNVFFNTPAPTVYAYASLGGGEYLFQLTAYGPYVRYTAI